MLVVTSIRKESLLFGGVLDYNDIVESVSLPVVVYVLRNPRAHQTSLLSVRWQSHGYRHFLWDGDYIPGTRSAPSATKPQNDCVGLQSKRPLLACGCLEVLLRERLRDIDVLQALGRK